MRVFHHDDGGIDHGPDGNGDTAETHDIGCDTQIVHADKRHDNRHGQGENYHQSAGQVKQEDETDYTDGKGQLDDLIFQSTDGALDQVRPVIGGDNLHTFGKAGRDVGLNFFFDPLDNGKNIFTEADNDNPPSNLSPAIQFRQTSSDFRPELNTGDIS